MNAPRYLSRGIDYLGDLGAKLRDLQGYRALAHELIQNADDAPTATSMSFDVGEEALIVDNDGVFTDCGQVDANECAWKTDGIRNHRCDFHRFRYVAAGDKRGEAGTTGAFGIGFIAVYQISDAPELISGGRHWVLYEDKPEEQRIGICPGCSACTHSSLPGTRFILPWARDGESALRRALRAEPAGPDCAVRMVEELSRSVPVAMLFLRRLRGIVVKHNGRLQRAIERVSEANSLIVSDGAPDNDQIWHLVHGDFADTASHLREKHRGRIEAKRSSKVTIAIPTSIARAGLLCACLPTEHDTGLPFHVNADFYPTNDRKRVILAEDYQSEWNRAALNAAARTAGQAVEQLPELLGAQRFWNLLSKLKEVADRTEQERGESTFGEFWTQVSSRLRAAPVIRTSKGDWVKAADACLLLQKEESAAVPTLEGLDIQVVHEDLRPYQGILRSEVVGAAVLGIEHLCRALNAAGLDRRIAVAELPSSLATPARRKSLYVEISLLLDRQQRTHKARADDERLLSGVALALGRDGALWPCREIYSADSNTVALFETLGLGIPFVESDADFAPLLRLCRTFDASAAVQALKNADESKLGSLMRGERPPMGRLFAWLEDRRKEILADSTVRSSLAALSLFPSAGTLRPLDSLALPGHFIDPLGLAKIVDLQLLDGRREFLRDLGMPELDFPTYATARLPAALANRDVSPEKRRAAILVLANHVGELKDNNAARQALSIAPVVECGDEKFCRADGCYLDEPAVRECLGGDANIAVLAAGHEAAVRDLYQWLGVADEPRLKHLVDKVRGLARLPYSDFTAAQIRKLISHLGGRDISDVDLAEISPLRSEKWIPARARHDRWYAPAELYASYQDYLFESQALFVDLPPSVQNASRNLLGQLGVRITPPVNLVVRHLIHCADGGISVNNEVYRFLNQNASDPSLGQLKDRRCLWLGDAYRGAREAFWSEHPFGRFRWRLVEDLRAYNVLLTILGVREIPNSRDSLEVLREISERFGSANEALDDEAYSVLMSCWRLIDSALDQDEELRAEVKGLRNLKCVPKRTRVLCPPEWMFFENRAGLAAKFGDFLAGNIIDKPLDTGGSLAQAGVRSLGTTVDVELLECGDPSDVPEMAERIRARRNEMGRVLDAQMHSQGNAELLDRLASMQCASAAHIGIRYRLRAFNRELISEQEQVPALYQRDQHLLVFARRDGHPPWAAIARELAIALFPEEDPGRLAAGLKESLAPETAMEAASSLDELGFPRVDTGIQDSVPTGAIAGTLGTEVNEGAPSPTEPGPMTPEEALKHLLGPDATSPTPPISDPAAEPVGMGTSKGNGTRSGTGAKKGRPVLRSYLPAPKVDDANSDGSEEEDSGARSSVDIAGVNRVLAHESSAGRSPKEMPHKNPGYDIESRNASGKVVRYIEVKSFCGDWRATYAVLSQMQFNKARELGELFWLYVVERAESDAFNIYCIQNPAVRANHFMFDDGWGAISNFDSN
jgi:hypothetical protein